MKDVWDQFQAKETFMAQSLEPMTELPSVFVCLASGSWSYSEGTIKIRSVINGSYKDMEENEALYELDGSSVVFHQESFNCFRVKFMPGLKIDKQKVRYVRIEFSKKTPSSIVVAFVSEENSYGYFNSEWFDGKVFRKNLSPGSRTHRCS